MEEVTQIMKSRTWNAQLMCLVLTIGLLVSVIPLFAITYAI